MTDPIPVGKAQIDSALLSALAAAGVKNTDAAELSRLDAFGGSPAQPWIAGLRAVATLFNRGSVSLDWGTLPMPWTVVGPALSVDGVDPGQTIIDALDGWNPEVQAALIGAIGMMSIALTTADTKKATTVPASSIKMQPIDATLAKLIQAILNRKGTKEQRRKAGGEQLLEWLWDRGEFIKTIYGTLYYLYRPDHRLFHLESNAWRTWLYLLSGCNPASSNFSYLEQDCQAAAEQYGKQKDVIRVAHWDSEHQILRVSRFDGLVYRLDGMTLELEANGDGPVLFEDASFWLPYSPDFSANGKVLKWSTADLPSWDGEGEEKSLLYLAWILATFFTELCPTRPIVTLKGEKGSGKSMLLRILLRMLFGAAVDVVGVPDKADAFISLTSNSHIVCFDNMDELVKEIRDKVASLSTGKIDQVRRLYTTNETQIIRYRCWLAITSRTPDTLQRDDLVDRILILPLRRIEDNNRSRESRFLMEVLQKRNQWWGDVLTALNAVVHEIHGSGLPDKGGLRMEDWAALGAVIARSQGQEDIWETGLIGVKARQAEFLLEDNVIVSALEAWIAGPSYTPSALYTRNLYDAAKSALFGVDRPDASWPRSVKSFGRRLSGIQRELREHLAKGGIQMSWRIIQGNLVYEFKKSP